MEISEEVVGIVVIALAAMRYLRIALAIKHTN